MTLGCSAPALSPLPLHEGSHEKHQIGQQIPAEHATLIDALCACGAVGEDWPDSFRTIAERIWSGGGDWIQVHGRSMVSDLSAVQQVATQLRLVVRQTDTGITRIGTAAQEIGRAYDVLGAVAQGSQHAELLKTVHQFDAAHPDRARHDPAGAAVLLDLSGADMTTTELTSLAAHDEIEISTIRQPGDLTTALATVNDQRGSSSGRVWFLVTNPDVEASCLVVGVRGDVGALEWIDDERLVPAHGLNAEWATYYTVHLHDNSMPPHAELPLTTVFAAAEEYVRTGRQPTCVEWMPATA